LFCHCVCCQKIEFAHPKGGDDDEAAANTRKRKGARESDGEGEDSNVQSRQRKSSE
jgi:hypothetical protein